MSMQSSLASPPSERLLALCWSTLALGAQDSADGSKSQAESPEAETRAGSSARAGDLETVEALLDAGVDLGTTEA